MPFPGAYFGAVIGFMAGVLLTGTVFGQTSNAGYHGRKGRLKSKNSATLRKGMFIAATTVAGMAGGPFLVAIALANPIMAAVAVLLILYVSLHMEIGGWNLI